MFIGGQAASTYLIEDLGDTGITGQVEAQHQGVDEEAHQFVQCRVAPAGDREAHCHIATRAKLGQQHRQRGLHHHETGDVVLSSHSGNLLLHLDGPVHRRHGAALVRHQRIGPIGGQRKTLRHPGQGLLPVGKLLGDTTVTVGQITELRPLPQRVIDILDRQFGPIGCAARTPTGIRHAHVSHERGDRPTVRGDVMYHRHPHMVVLADPEKLRAQGDLGCQIETAQCRILNGLRRPAFRPPGGIDHLPAEIGLPGLDHHLLWNPVGSGEQRA